MGLCRTVSLVGPVNDDVLSTGEAARLIGTSRQHVVDLCRKGVLPFTLTGTHRRVRRHDVERLKGEQQLTDDQSRSLWLSHAVAGELVRDPARVLDLARSNLARLQDGTHRGMAHDWLVEWGRLLDGPVEGVLEALTSPLPHFREMRQNNPFAGALSPADRTAVLRAHREAQPPHDT